MLLYPKAASSLVIFQSGNWLSLDPAIIKNASTSSSLLESLLTPILGAKARIV